MKKINILTLCLMICLMLAVPVMGQALCTEATTSTNQTFFNMQWNVSTNGYTFNSEQQLGGISEMWPTAVTALEICENHTVFNGTSVSLQWPIVSPNATVTNATLGSSMGNGDGGEDSNYTYNNVTGVVVWNFTNGLEDGNLSQICYNKTMTPYDDNIGDSTIYNLSKVYSLGSNTGYGDDTNITLLARTLNNSNINTNYTLTTRDCDIADSCRGTQTIIYSGFALIALFAIILAAWGIISAFNTGDISVIGIALVSSVIALGFIVMVGYIIVANVGQSVCGV